MKLRKRKKKSKQTRKWKIVRMLWRFNIRIIVLKRADRQNGGWGAGPVDETLCKCAGWRLAPWHRHKSWVHGSIPVVPSQGKLRQEVPGASWLTTLWNQSAGFNKQSCPVSQVQHDGEVNFCPPHAWSQTGSPTCEHTCRDYPDWSRVPLRLSIRSNPVQWLTVSPHQGMPLWISEHVGWNGHNTVQCIHKTTPSPTVLPLFKRKVDFTRWKVRLTFS